MNQDQEKKIELHHESIEEILGTPPASMIRVGSGILLMVILGLLIGSRFFTYPDMVQAPAILQGDDPLSIQTSPETGKILNILRPINNWVEAGDTLFTMEKSIGEIFSVMAMAAGLIEFNPLLDIKPQVNKNDTVAIIWRKETGLIACVIKLLPDQGKNVKVGNKIIFHLNKYPSKQFGVIESYVKSISHFNTSRYLQIIAELPGTITTSNHHEIFLRGNIYASAEIITGEQTIFNRLVNPFRGLVR